MTETPSSSTGGDQWAAGFIEAGPRRDSAAAATPDNAAPTGANGQGGGASGFGGGERPAGDGRGTPSRSLNADTGQAATWRRVAATSAIDITA
jgi:hypothetical protein